MKLICDAFWGERTGQKTAPERFRKLWEMKVAPLLDSPSNAWEAESEAEEIYREWIAWASYVGNQRLEGGLTKLGAAFDAALKSLDDSVTRTLQTCASSPAALVEEKIDAIREDLADLKELGKTEEKAAAPAAVDLKPVLLELAAEREAREADRRAWERRWKWATIGFIGLGACMAIMLLALGVQTIELRELADSISQSYTWK